MEKQTTHRFERHQFANDERKANAGSDKRSHVTSLIQGQEYDVIIEDIGHNGDGFVKLEEYTVFVPNTEKGESVRIKILKVKDTVAFAQRIS